MLHHLVMTQTVCTSWSILPYNLSGVFLLVFLFYFFFSEQILKLEDHDLVTKKPFSW